MSLALHKYVHVPRAVTMGLRMRGIDVLTAQADGSAELDDGSLLRRATDLGRIMVTQDDDVLREAKRLLDEGRMFCGITYAHQLRVTIGQMVEDLELIARATASGEWVGKIEYLPLG